MAVTLGRQEFLHDARDAEDRPVLSIMCTSTVYRRADGSLFMVQAGRRRNLTRLPDGRLTIVTRGREW